MTVKGFVKKLLTNACIYFSLIMLLYIIIAAIINVVDDALLLDAGRVVLFFVFSVLLAAANSLYALKKPSGGVRLLIHYAITLFAFYTCFMLSLSLRASSTLVGIVVFTAVYFAIMGILTAVRSKYRSNTQNAEKYISQYGKARKNSR
ncbi:MAG: hypothetical protein IJY08_00185 [Clostridia bacterium]|nr:hypothetical protein [Clostridia bacterium]